MFNEFNPSATSSSPLEAFGKGNYDQGLQLLGKLMHGPNIHNLAIDIYNYEQENPSLAKHLSSADTAKFRIIKMRIHDKIIDDFENNGMRLDYPPMPDQVKNAYERGTVKQIWDKLDKIPKGVLIAGLKKAIVVLPKGHLVISNDYVDKEYSGSSLTVGDKQVDANLQVAEFDGIVVNAISINLVGKREVIIKNGKVSVFQHGKPTTIQPKPIFLVTRDVAGVFHINVRNIIENATFGETFPFPPIIDPLNTIPRMPGDDSTYKRIQENALKIIETVSSHQVKE